MAKPNIIRARSQKLKDALGLEFLFKVPPRLLRHSEADNNACEQYKSDTLLAISYFLTESKESQRKSNLKLMCYFII